MRPSSKHGGPAPARQIHSMPLFWLAHRQKGIACVLILQASSLISARLKASLQIDGIDKCFAQRIRARARA